MTNLELKNKLVELFPEYKFNDVNDETYSIHGVLELKPRTFRDGKKNLVKTQNRIIFVSCEMYPNTDKNFRYALNYTTSQMRMYRCKNWLGNEYKKAFVSGKTDEILLSEMKMIFN
jgi:hypothetical protein